MPIYPRGNAVLRPRPVPRTDFRSPRTDRRDLGRDARANARTPLKPPASMTQLEDMIRAGVDVAQFFPGPIGVFARILGRFMDLLDLFELLQQLFNPKVLVIPPGWSQCPTPTCGDNVARWGGLIGSTCTNIATCQQGGSSGWNNFYDMVGNNLLITQQPRIALASATFRYIAQFVRSGGSQWYPRLKGAGMPDVDIFAPPAWLDPGNIPINNPGIDYPPRQITDIPDLDDMPAGDRAPNEETQRGPRPVPPPDTGPDVEIFPPGDPGVYPGVGPSSPGNPGPVIIIPPVDNPPVVMLPPPSKPLNPQPPGPGVKERKIRIGLTGGPARIVNVITEGRDFVQALWKALPKKFRSKPKKGRKTLTVQQMLRDIYDHLNDIDLADAVLNVIENEIQDRFYGKAGQKYRDAARANPYWERPVGYQFGDRYRPNPDVHKFKDDDIFQQIDRAIRERLPHYSPRQLRELYWPA